jgi:hypothetical protein
MAKPVLVVVDDENASLRALARERESRYGAHYQVVSGSSAEAALARLAELKAAGSDVPLVLANDRDLLVVGLEDGSQARAVVIASGVSYRRLQVPDLEAWRADTAAAAAASGSRPSGRSGPRPGRS